MRQFQLWWDEEARHTPAFINANRFEFRKLIDVPLEDLKDQVIDFYATNENGEEYLKATLISWPRLITDNGPAPDA